MAFTRKDEKAKDCGVMVIPGLHCTMAPYVKG